MSHETLSRRTLLSTVGAGLAVAPHLAEARTPPARPAPASSTGALVVPDGETLPLREVGGVKVGHLVVQEVEHEFTRGLVARCWAYGPRVHGPVIEATEGERLRLYVTNRLSTPTTVHWHGLLVPNGMDGVGGLHQTAIPPGETYRYEFPLKQHGTFMFHSHHDEMTQMAMGLVGMFVVHPKRVERPVQRDFALMLHEWHIPVGARRPNPNAMSEFNVLTLNGRCFPGTAPLMAHVGDRVRIRLGNLSAMDHHPIHLHGHTFEVVETDGGVIPAAGRWPETTVLVPTGSTRTVEFTCTEPGDWPLHCHMTHHVMNQMGHGFPNMIGVDAGALDPAVRSLVPGYMTMGQDGMAGMDEMGMPIPPNSVPMQGGRGPFGGITMGGMFTLLKVRERGAVLDPASWWRSPAAEQARAATEAELQADGIPSRLP